MPLGAVAVTAVSRVLVHLSTRGRHAAFSQLPLLAMRDTLTLALWGWSFASRRVQWRNDSFWITEDGSVERFLGEDLS